jgi:UDP-glucose 4-epimerase
MRVLVTGGAGFIGSNLVDRLLAEGCDVDVVDDLSTGALANLAEARAQRSRRCTFHRMDLRSPQLAELVVQRSPEVVFHLGGHGDARAAARHPMLDAEVNVLGSLNLFEAAVAARSRKVVFAGSGATLYGAPEAVPVRESHPQRPLSHLGVSKKAAGDYLLVYRERHGLEFTVLALASVYGPRQDPSACAGVVAVFAGQLLAGRRPTIYGSGTQTRDFLFVDDAVDAFVRAIDRGGGLVVNVGTGVETTIRELYMRLAALTGAGDDEPQHASGRPDEPEGPALDAGRAAIQLGWKPWTALDDGLAVTVDWYRAQR